MPTVHSVIDYALARRAALVDLFAGRADRQDLCDAHPDLLRAARHHGVATEIPCPVCRRETLWHVSYAYGEGLGESAGYARSSAEIPELAERCGQVRVYVVEVCRGCSWNHLVTSYAVGTAREMPSRPRRRRAGADR